MKEPTKSSSKKKILVVEDEEYLRDLYVELLEEAGFEVNQAVDGEEGLELMQKGGYDLVLLDIMLPKMDAIKILQKLKKEKPPKKPNRRVVFLTNLSQGSAISKGASLGVKDYMIKSDLTPDQFLKEVGNYLT